MRDVENILGYFSNRLHDVFGILEKLGCLLRYLIKRSSENISMFFSFFSLDASLLDTSEKLRGRLERDVVAARARGAVEIRRHFEFPRNRI